MTTPIIVIGAAGRMGQAVLRCATESDEFTIVGGIERPDSPTVGGTVGTLLGKPGIEAPVVADPSGLSAVKNVVAIDFSSPESTLTHLEWSATHVAGLVIGTTGMKDAQRARVAHAAQAIPVVFAPNMSVGVNALFKIVGEVARILGEEYDVEIAETHHRFKKDAPSGTARRLGELIAEAWGGTYDQLVVNGRSGMTGERPRRQIGMHALRAGDVVGEHTVTFATLGERIELTHRAHNRDTFARGALRAAAWVASRPAGLYTMEDVLGLR